MVRSRGRPRASPTKFMHTDPLHSFVVYVSLRRTSKISYRNFLASEPTTIAGCDLLIFSKTSCWSRPGFPNSAANENRAFCIPAHVNGPNLSASADGDSSGYDTRVTTHLHVSQQSFQQIVSGRLFFKAERSGLPYVNDTFVL